MDKLKYYKNLIGKKVFVVDKDYAKSYPNSYSIKEGLLIEVGFFKSCKEDVLLNVWIYELSQNLHCQERNCFLNKENAKKYLQGVSA